MKFPASSRGLSRKQEARSQGEPLSPHPHPAARDCTHRRHGSGHPGAPRGAQDLLFRDVPGGPRSREPPGRVQGRAAARLGPRGGPPARAWPALTSRSGGPGNRLQPSPGPAPRDPGPRPRRRRRRRRASSPGAGARPACQRGGRPAVAAAAPSLLCLSFLQPTPRPPRAGPVPALPGPHAASARPATPAWSLSAAGLRRRAASGKRPGAAEPGAGKPAGVGGCGGGEAGTPPLRLRRPRGRSAAVLGPGRRGGRSQAPGKRRRSWRFPGQPPGKSARGGGGGAGRVRVGAARLRPPLAEETAGNESARPGRPRCVRADRIGGRCLRGDFPLPAFASTGGSLP